MGVLVEFNAQMNAFLLQKSKIHKNTPNVNGDHGRPEGGKGDFPLDFGTVLLNVLIILIFNNKWPCNYHNDPKNVKRIKILTLSPVRTEIWFESSVLPAPPIPTQMMSTLTVHYQWEGETG